MCVVSTCNKPSHFTYREIKVFSSPLLTTKLELKRKKFTKNKRNCNALFKSQIKWLIVYLHIWNVIQNIKSLKYLPHLIIQNNWSLWLRSIGKVFWVAWNYHSSNIPFLHVVFYLKLLHIHSILALIPFVLKGHSCSKKLWKSF